MVINKPSCFTLPNTMSRTASIPFSDIMSLKSPSMVGNTISTPHSFALLIPTPLVSLSAQITIFLPMYWLANICVTGLRFPALNAIHTASFVAWCKLSAVANPSAINKVSDSIGSPIQQCPPAILPPE